VNTEQKHTPGPWRVDYAQGIMTQDGDAIAYCCEDCSSTPSPNARLIAAAPDLLEALKAAVAYPITGNWYEQAEAAIAKAEGKA
jgi:hypothetical protein